MHKGNTKTRWQRFCAAMVEHGHGRSSDISAASAQRRPRSKSKGKRKAAAKETPNRTLRFGALGIVGT